MAHAPSQDSKVADLPTIIIDPCVYEPERRAQPHSLGRNVRRLTRVMLLVSAVGTTTIVVAHVLEADSLPLRERVLALTTQLSDLTYRRADKPTRALTIQPDTSPAAVLEKPKVSALVARPAETVVPEPTPAAAEPAPPVELASAVAADAPAAAPTEEPSAPSAESQPVVKHAPTLQEVLWNARRMLVQNRVEDAEAAYRKVLVLNDRQPAALVGLARVQLTRGQLDEALSLAQRAVDKAPDQASSHLALGDVLRARGDKVAAQAQYEQATLRSASQAPSASAARADASN